jgi:hypothetical protein
VSEIEVYFFVKLNRPATNVLTCLLTVIVTFPVLGSTLHPWATILRVGSAAATDAEAAAHAFVVE